MGFALYRSSQGSLVPSKPGLSIKIISFNPGSVWRGEQNHPHRADEETEAQSRKRPDPSCLFLLLGGDGVECQSPSPWGGLGLKEQGIWTGPG